MKIEITEDPELLKLIERDISFPFRLVAAIRRGAAVPVTAIENGREFDVGKIIGD